MSNSKLAGSSGQSVRELSLEDVRLIWDDFDLLFAQYPPLVAMADQKDALKQFVECQLSSEHAYFTRKQEKIEIKTGLEAVSKEPYNYPYRRLLFHNDRFIVGLASATDPHLESSEKVLQEQEVKGTLDRQFRWPLPPGRELCDLWQFEGVNEPMDATNPEKPQLFHTFDTLTNDDEEVEKNLPIEARPDTKKLLDFLSEDARPPCFKYGKLCVGQFDDIDSNQILWDTDLGTNLPYHVQAAGLSDPDLKHVMAVVYNRMLHIYDLNHPADGPAATLDLQDCKSKAIIDVVATSKFIAILDGRNYLHVIPWNPKDTLNSLEASKIIRLWVPTSFSLGKHQGQHEILYLGTKHGFIHELTLGAVAGIQHSRTYYTRQPSSVQFIQGRGHRLVCGSSHAIFVFSNNKSDGSDAYLRMETGSGYLLGIRNIQFQGNVVLFETNNRHLNLINLITKSQRILPSSLGAFRKVDPKEEEYYERLRESSFSIVVWDSVRAIIRVAYKNLTTETWNFCLGE